MNGQNPTPLELLQKFAGLMGLPIQKRHDGLACKMADGTILTLYEKPVVTTNIGKNLIYYGMYFNPSEKHLRRRMLDKDRMEYLRKKMEESIETLELRAIIMDPKNLETAERMAKKRRNLQEVYDLLSSKTCAEIKVKVCVNMIQVKEAAISDAAFNDRVAKLVEEEINNIDKFVESL